ncbi:hypothetical protein B566_EDAN011610 [Ephemera danica]|nr:hypothetical protein B566_EDAN011610 [Ephemera danica]
MKVVRASLDRGSGLFQCVTMALPGAMHLLLLLLLPGSISTMSIFEAAWGALQKGTNFLNAAVPDAETLLPEYDFIVVGGGTAGCVVASRLSEDPSRRVLLLEAGREESYIMDVPLLANFFQLTETNWGHRTVPQKGSCQGMTNGRCKFPRGKVMGGSSTINYMIYTRGNKRDYDRWRDMGNPGWGWDDVLPYFQRIEDVQVPEMRQDPMRGRDGPVTLMFPPYHTPLAESFLESAAELGYEVRDYNSDAQTAISWVNSHKDQGRLNDLLRVKLCCANHACAVVCWWWQRLSPHYSEELYYFTVKSPDRPRKMATPLVRWLYLLVLPLCGAIYLGGLESSLQRYRELMIDPEGLTYSVPLSRMRAEYDFIVIGAGTAGATITNQLDISSRHS